MPNLIKIIRKGRTQLILGLAFVFTLVLGIPWVDVNVHSQAANPYINPTVVVSATSPNQLLIPNGPNGSPIVVPANIVVCVAEEVTFKAKGVPSGGTYGWTYQPLGGGSAPPFFWKLPQNALTGTAPINSNGESFFTKRFAIPGIYRATVYYSHPQGVDPATGYVTVMVVDHTRVNFATNTYVPGNGTTGKAWSETPAIYPSYTSNYDSDDDGLPDAWETKYFGNLSQNWSGDPDSDSLSNARELALNTYPAVDSDQDGLANWWESYYGLDPNSSGDAALDSDGDGWTNAEEFAHGTNPWLIDTDGDGIPDKTDPDPLKAGSVLAEVITFKVLTVLE